jgi:hypothetical protein
MVCKLLRDTCKSAFTGEANASPSQFLKWCSVWAELIHFDRICDCLIIWEMQMLRAQKSFLLYYCHSTFRKSCIILLTQCLYGNNRTEMNRVEARVCLPVCCADNKRPTVSSAWSCCHRVLHWLTVAVSLAVRLERVNIWFHGKWFSFSGGGFDRLLDLVRYFGLPLILRIFRIENSSRSSSLHYCFAFWVSWDRIFTQKPHRHQNSAGTVWEQWLLLFTFFLSHS